MSSQILSLSIDSRRHRVYLKLSGGLFFPLSLDDYTILKLSSHQDLDDQLLTKITTLSLQSLLLNYALRQIALSPQSPKILRQKLHRSFLRFHRRYHYPQSPVDKSAILDQVIDKIEKQNLLDSTAYLEHLIYHHRQKSSRHLQFLFHQSGIPSSTYSPYLEKLHQDDLQKIKLLLQKKSLSSKLADPKTRFSLIASLARKGFNQDMVKSAIDDFLQNR